MSITTCRNGFSLGCTSFCILRKTSRRNIGTRAGDFLKVSDQVSEAIKAKAPVVALETTIYTHGLPYPDNLHLATRLEAVVRQEGATPATIGILDGVARVGMSSAELKSLVERPGARKISRRDLGFATGLGVSGRSINGGTTIAGTMVLAHLAGIKVFATGGLGGVHRDGENSMDISADLTELGRTPVAVISSGCKGFLDIGRTLEYLETQGVGVATFADGRGESVDFPAFWSRDSGHKSPMVLKDEVEAAGVIYAQSALGMTSGLFFANPVPESHSIPRPELDTIIEQAIQSAQQAGATGSANTPFILDTIKTLSGGRSVAANWALVESNVCRGARVALQLSRLEQQHVSERSLHSSIDLPSPAKLKVGKTAREDARTKQVSTQAKISTDAHMLHVNVLVAGSTAVDTCCNYTPLPGSSDATAPQSGTSNPSSISQSVGGVGFNVAKAAKLAGAHVKLCSLVADDLAGRLAIETLSKQGLFGNGVQIVPTDSGFKTSQYVAVNDARRNLALAMADMNIMEMKQDHFDSQWRPHLESLAHNTNPAEGPRWLILDANWAPVTLHKWLAAARSLKIATAFEPVSASKSTRLFARQSVVPTPLPRIVDLAAPNELELVAMHEAASTNDQMSRADWWATIDALGISASGARAELVAATSQTLVDQGIPQRSIQLLPFVPTLLTKLGPRGVLLTRILSESDAALRNAGDAQYIISRSKTGQNGVGGLYMRHFAPEEVIDEKSIVSVNGAGDTFLGTLIARLARMKDPTVETVVDIAQKASALTLKSEEAVSSELAQLR